MLAALMRAAGQPGDMAAAVLRFWTSVARIGPVAVARWLAERCRQKGYAPLLARAADPINR
jgi:hypothetical protein